MAKLEDDLKIKVKVASPEIRAIATVMNSMVFKKIIHNNTLIGDGENEPLGVAPEILSDISTAKSDITSLKTADLQLETKILNLSTKQSQTDTKITYINMDITNIKTDVSNLQTDVSNLKTDLSTTNANIAQIDAKFADYLPLSGGTITGELGINTKGYKDYPKLIDDFNELQIGYHSTILGRFYPLFRFNLASGNFYPYANNRATLGIPTLIWKTVYAATLNNGADLIVPTEQGTIARIEDIPTLLSQLTNDLGFATSAEVQALIAALPKYKVEKVSALPETGEELVLYLVPKDGSTNDVYDEYIWEDGSYELLGTTQVDLSGYVSQDEFSNTISGIATDFVQWVAFDGGTVGQVLTKTEDGFSWQDAQVGDVFPDQTGNYGKFLITDGQTVSWTDTLTRGLTILTSNTFGSPMFSLSAGGQYNWTFYVQQTGLELHYGGYQRNVLKFPTTGGTLATTQNIADIGGAGTTGQVLTKTADGFSWQDSQGGGGGESLPTGGSNGDVLTLNNDTPTWSAPVARHNYISGYVDLPDNGRWFFYPSVETTENIVEFSIARNGEFQGKIILQIFSGSNMTPRAKWLTSTHNLVDPEVYFDPNYNLGSLMIKIRPGISGGGISVYPSAIRLGNPSNSTGIGYSPDYTLPSDAIAAVWDSGLPTTTSSNVDGQVLALEEWNGEYRPKWAYPVARALPSSQIYSQREFWYKLDNVNSTINCVRVFVENAEDGGENERYYVHFIVDDNTTPKIIAESHTPQLFDVEIFADLGNAGYGQVFGVVHITPKETANIARFVVGATRIGDPIASYRQQVLYTYTPGDQGTITAQYMFATEQFVDNIIADFATQTHLYIDTVVGDINSVLDTINGEVV